MKHSTFSFIRGTLLISNPLRYLSVPSVHLAHRFPCPTSTSRIALYDQRFASLTPIAPATTKSRRMDLGQANAFIILTGKKRGNETGESGRPRKPNYDRHAPYQPVPLLRSSSFVDIFWRDSKDPSRLDGAPLTGAVIGTDYRNIREFFALFIWIWSV